MENNSTVIKLAVPNRPPTSWMKSAGSCPLEEGGVPLGSPYEIERCFRKKLDPFSMSRYIDPGIQPGSEFFRSGAEERSPLFCLPLDGLSRLW